MVELNPGEVEPLLAACLVYQGRLQLDPADLEGSGRGERRPLCHAAIVAREFGLPDLDQGAVRDGDGGARGADDVDPFRGAVSIVA